VAAAQHADPEAMQGSVVVVEVVVVDVVVVDVVVVLVVVVEVVDVDVVLVVEVVEVVVPQTPLTQPLGEAHTPAYPDAASIPHFAPASSP